MSQPSVIGIDLGKRLFHVVALDERGARVLERRCTRSGLMRLLGRLERCRVAMEACATSHYWGRRLSELGHEVVLLPPQHVKPYRRGQKNDLRDAAAIAEAASRAGIPAVAVKTEAQQLLATLVRIRAGQVRTRTAIANRLRAHLAEFGQVLPRGLGPLRSRLREVFGGDDGPRAALPVPPALLALLQPLYQQLCLLDAHIAALDEMLARRAREDETLRRLCTIPGIGPVTAATFAAAVGAPGRFRMAARPPPGWAWCPVSTPRAGGFASAGSPSTATRISAAAWSTPLAPSGVCGTPLPALSANGYGVWAHAAIPMSTWSHWPIAWHASPGRSWPREGASNPNVPRPPTAHSAERI